MATLAHTLNHFLAENIPWEWTKPCQRLPFSDGPFNWQLTRTILNIVHPRTMEMQTHCLACRGKPLKLLTTDWKREIKSIESKLNVHPLQQPESEKLQEGMQFFLVSCILYRMVGQQKRTHRRSSDFIAPNEKNFHLLKSRKFNPIVQRGFEVGEPDMVKDFRNRGTTWTKGVVQDRLGPVTYRVQVWKFLWKRDIDQLRQLVGSKIADVEPKSCDLREIDSSDTLDESVPVPTSLGHSTSHSVQSVPNEMSTMPLVEVLKSGLVAPQEENITPKVT